MRAVGLAKSLGIGAGQGPPSHRGLWFPFPAGRTLNAAAPRLVEGRPVVGKYVTLAAESNTRAEKVNDFIKDD